MRLIALFVFTLLFSACAAPSTPSPIMTDIPTQEIASTPEPTLPPVQTEHTPSSGNLSLTQTYTDDLAGFSINYPAGWFIDFSAGANAAEAFAYSVPIASWDLRNPPTPSGKNPNTLPEGGTKIDVNVMKQPMTLEEAVAQQSQNEMGSPILARKDVTLANGLPAVILDVEGFIGLTRTLIAVLNGNVIYVSGYGNLEHFEAIALTLRPK
ncbi:MAG TPA: hypothetical protein VFY66_04595 [Anaerolineales bacterium]|nr:hypothetical protein [Anaerolineales bacterium]